MVAFQIMYWVVRKIISFFEELEVLALAFSIKVVQIFSNSNSIFNLCVVKQQDISKMLGAPTKNYCFALIESILQCMYAVCLVVLFFEFFVSCLLVYDAFENADRRFWKESCVSIVIYGEIQTDKGKATFTIKKVMVKV